MDSNTTIAELRKWIEVFKEERDWGRYHKPKDLLLAVVEEIGELSECYLWLTDEEIEKAYKDKDKFEKIKGELADIYIFLISFTNELDIDLAETIKWKLAKTAKKYPVESVKSKHMNKWLKDD